MKLPKPQQFIPEKAGQFKLNWKAYFISFCELHGQPIQSMGKLIFPDGFSYAMDYRGPEWPPPTDPYELRRMLLTYWRGRLALVALEFKSLKQAKYDLLQLQTAKSAPLQVTSSFKDDSGFLQTQTNSLDMLAMNARLEWLEEDVAECKKRIAALDRGDKYVADEPRKIMPRRKR